MIDVRDPTDKQLKLSSGRSLGYREYGDPGARPIFYFHGWPGSRLEPLALLSTGQLLHARIVAVDRPGYGLSSHNPARNLVDWPADVAELASGLGVGRFEVVGVSGGGPYAAACAALLPERVKSATLVCSMGPCDVPGGTRGMALHNRCLLALARLVPRLAWHIASTGIDYLRKQDDFIPRSLRRRLPESDRRCIEDPRVHASLMKNWREAFRDGNAGALVDGSLFARPWGFNLREIKVPVTLFHGMADIIVPLRMGAYLAEHIPGARSFFLEGEGHFSLPLSRASEIWRPQSRGE